MESSKDIQNYWFASHGEYTLPAFASIGGFTLH